MSIARRKLIALGVLAGALTAAGGLAAAGALPGTADGRARDATADMTIPSPNANAGVHPDERGSSDTTQVPHTTETTEADEPEVADPPADEPAEEEESEGKGATISSIARDPDLHGRDKGAAVSAAASEGKSRAGQDHGAAKDKPAR